jgi:hypothetical protein
MKRWWEEKRCLSCKHWCGDRDEEWARIHEWIREGHDLDKLYSIKAGPCNDGPGGINSEWIGNGYAEVTVDADFGCVEWEAIEGDER